MELNPRDRGTGRSSAPWSITWAGRASEQARRCRSGQHRAAVPVQQPARRRGAAGRALCRLPRRRLQPGLDRVPRQGHRHGRPRRCRQERFEVDEPYVGITPESRFELSGATDLPAELTLDRLDGAPLAARAVRQAYASTRRQRRPPRPATAIGRWRYDLIGSKKVRQALDLGASRRRCASRTA